MLDFRFYDNRDIWCIADFHMTRCLKFSNFFINLLFSFICRWRDPFL